MQIFQQLYRLFSFSFLLHVSLFLFLSSPINHRIIELEFTLIQQKRKPVIASSFRSHSHIYGIFSNKFIQTFSAEAF
jgi:hypothetical protein